MEIRIAPGGGPPAQINEWMESHMTNYTGIFNVQYIGERIIEGIFTISKRRSLYLWYRKRSLYQRE